MSFSLKLSKLTKEIDKASGRSHAVNFGSEQLLQKKDCNYKLYIGIEHEQPKLYRTTLAILGACVVLSLLPGINNMLHDKTYGNYAVNSAAKFSTTENYAADSIA